MRWNSKAQQAEPPADASPAWLMGYRDGSKREASANPPMHMGHEYVLGYLTAQWERRR